jgi:hypothetical protein
MKGEMRRTLEHEEDEEGEIVARLCRVADVVKETEMVVRASKEC